MGLHCKTCGVPLKDRKNLYCRPHAVATLKHLERVGYLEPLTISTVDGTNQRVSKQRFLTLRDDQVRETAKTSD